MSYTYEKYIEENDEIRCGFKVSANRKKVWNIQLGLLEELKKICKKHNIKYYAEGGTLLGAIRHGGFIPRDDDVDLVMFREDYEKFLKIAPRELPKHIKIGDYYGKFSQLINLNTAALRNENRRTKDFIGGIRIDIFPVDFASKFLIINRLKYKIMYLLRILLFREKSNRYIMEKKTWKILIVKIIKNISSFLGINYLKTRKFYEIINQKVLFKGENVYTGRCPYIFYPKNIFDKSHDVKFENTYLCIPDGYDEYLKITYGNYMKPVVFSGGHNCRYSVKKSYKDIIKKFDKGNSNEENYNHCQDLFLL